MNTQAIRKLLLFAGYAGLIAYVLQAFASNALRLQKAVELGASEEILNDTSRFFLFGVIIESPMHLAPAILCLVAAKYLSNLKETIPEIFE